MCSGTALPQGWLAEYLLIGQEQKSKLSKRQSQTEPEKDVASDGLDTWPSVFKSHCL